MVSEDFKPVPFADRLGQRKVIIEVPSPPPAVRKIDKRHEHTVRWGVFDRVVHRHEVDVDAPAHIHEHIHEPEDPSAA